MSDPDKIFDLSEKLRASGIFLWTEVEQFVDAFFTKNKSMQRSATSVSLR
ncbi:hypothetical protein [Vibrio taketomensis]|nr:hypothetical protein [Vibrio taketomensis]